MTRSMYLLVIIGTYIACCHGQSSLTCPYYPLVNVSTNNINNLMFSEFPSDSPNPEVGYSPGGLGPWYDISSGIINVVRPGSVTRDVVLPLLGNNLTSFTAPNPQTLAQDLARWWASIIALTILGGILSCSFCFCCGCFVLCRLCGKCGGNLKQEETSRMNCLTIVFTIILILFVCGLIAGIVLSFFSNQRIYDSVNEFEDTINDTFTTGENFINDSINKVDTLLCQLNDTLDITVNDARGLLRRVDEVIESFQDDVYGIVDTTVSLSSALETVQRTLTNIGSGATTLQTSASSLNGQLQSIANDIDSLNASCAGMCSGLDSRPIRNGLANDFSQLPNITNELQNVQNLLGTVNLTNLAQQGNATFNNALNSIRNLTQNADTEIVSAVNTLRGTVFNISGTVKNLANNITGDSGYVPVARDTVNRYFSTARSYDTPRYAIGIVISCSSVIVVFVVFLGILCGLCGFRTDRAPYERTDLSNCGGVTLICGAIIGFLFGFLMFLLAALIFFGGSVLEKFCNDLQERDYILISNTIDDPSLNGGQYLLSSAILQNGSIPLRVTDMLNDCSNQNTTVFEALKLNQSSYFKDINNFTNLSRIVPDVSGEVGSFARNITNVIGQDTFVPQDVQNTLNGFDTTGVIGIDIRQFNSELNQATLSFDVNAQIQQLTALRNNFTNANRTSQANATQMIIDDLMVVQNNSERIQSQASSLERQVQLLDNNTQELRNGVDNLLRNINETFERLINDSVEPLAQEVEAVFPRSIGYGQQLIDHALRSLETRVGNCYPVYAVYTNFYNAACEFTLDGLNGFWLSLGFCGVMLIPIIIFSIVTSQYYRRMKYEEDLALPYDDSFPLKDKRY